MDCDDQIAVNHVPAAFVRTNNEQAGIAYLPELEMLLHLTVQECVAEPFVTFQMLCKAGLFPPRPVRRAVSFCIQCFAASLYALISVKPPVIALLWNVPSTDSAVYRLAQSGLNRINSSRVEANPP